MHGKGEDFFMVLGVVISENRPVSGIHILKPVFIFYEGENHFKKERRAFWVFVQLIRSL